MRTQVPMLIAVDNTKFAVDNDTVGSSLDLDMYTQQCGEMQ